MMPAQDIPDRDEAAEQLRAIVERIERLNDEISDLNAEKAVIRAEAKSNGFDVPTITAIVQRRKKEPQALIEADALLETYEAALGCGAAAAGTLSASKGDDGVYRIAMVAAAPAEKLTAATKARREAVALAELSRRAREAQ